MPVLSGQPTTTDVPGDGPRVLATPEPGGDRPRVRLDVADATVDTSDIARVSADGSSVLVRESARTPNGSGVTFDYEAFFEESVTYRLLEGGTASETVSLDVHQVWLIHCFRPSASVRLDVAGRGEPRLQAGSWSRRSKPTSRVLVRPWGPRLPIAVTSGGRRGHDSQLLVRTPTLADLDALDDVTGDDSTLLLNVPPSLGLGVASCYVSVGDLDEARREGTWGDDPVRLWQMPYTQVQAPFGRIQPEWTWEDMEERYATLDEADDDFETWEDQETDTRRVR